MKVCSKCGLEKDESEFVIVKTTKDKLSTICRNCKKEYDIKYGLRNSKKIANNKAVYYQKNKQNFSKKNKELYKMIKEKKET